MYLDNLPAIAAGRELSAFPKKLGSAKLFVDSDTLVGTLDYGTLRVATATMGYKHKPLDLEKAQQEVGVPTFMLKILPGYAGRCESANWYAPRSLMSLSKAPGSGPPGYNSSSMR
jgi:acetoacetate decarboxylase